MANGKTCFYIPCKNPECDGQCSKYEEEAPRSAADLADEYEMSNWTNAQLAERYSVTMPDSQARALLWLLSQRLTP